MALQRYGTDAKCSILHVDMDAFYVSVEIQRDPSLRDKPVIVGGTGPRGVVSSAGYVAREFGVRSAMPITQARRLCPHGVFLPVDMPAYRRASAKVMRIFSDFTPLVEPLSVDEAFLDVAGVRQLFGSAEEIATRIRTEIAAELSLTCSVGVASTKFVAKLASTMAKPDGLLVVGANETLTFLRPLPVRALWGVGPRTHDVLRKLGISTVSDVERFPIQALRRAVGHAVAEHLHALSTGRDPRRVTPDRAERSVGAEETFSTDLTELAAIHKELLKLATKVAGRLRVANQLAKTVAIKVRFGDFRTVSRSRTLASPTNMARQLYTTVSELYQSLDLDRPLIRLLGVRGEQLVSAQHAGVQLSLDAKPGRWQEAEDVIEEVSRRFGSSAIRPAILIDTTGVARRERE